MRGRISLPLILLLAACGDAAAPRASPPPAAPACAPDSPELRAARERMITEQIRRMGVDDPRLLDAFRTVPRHRFVAADRADASYEDRPVRTPAGETLPSPDLTAAMVDALGLDAGSRVLECGTRSGFTTALLGRLAKEVFTIDARPAATARARAVLHGLGIENVRYRTGDPLAGWPGAGPFDAIVVNGVVRHLPRVLYESLLLGGRLLGPVGLPGETQTLVLTIRGDPQPLSTRAVLAVRFGPLAR